MQKGSFVMKLQKYIILILVLVSTFILTFAEAIENEKEFNVGDVIVDDQKYIKVSSYFDCFLHEIY